LHVDCQVTKGYVLILVLLLLGECLVEGHWNYHFLFLLDSDCLILLLSQKCISVIPSEAMLFLEQYYVLYFLLLINNPFVHLGADFPDSSHLATGYAVI